MVELPSVLVKTKVVELCLVPVEADLVARTYKYVCLSRHTQVDVSIQ